jgi:hypothetical protein
MKKGSNPPPPAGTIKPPPPPGPPRAVRITYVDEISEMPEPGIDVLRRVTACVKACAGIPTVTLELDGWLREMNFRKRLAEAEQQCNRLREVLQAIVNETIDYPPVKPHSNDSYLPAHLIEQAQAAIDETVSNG